MYILFLTVSFAILTVLMVIAFILSIKRKEYAKAVVAVFIAFIFFSICSFAYNLYTSNITALKQYAIVKLGVSKILSKKTKDEEAKAYIYGKALKGSYSEDKRIIQCYNEFHNFKETAECVKGLENE